VLIPRIPNECELGVMVNLILTNKCEITSPLLPSPTSRRIKVVPKFLFDNQSRNGRFREMADRISEFSHPPPRYFHDHKSRPASIDSSNSAPVTRLYCPYYAIYSILSFKESFLLLNIEQRKKYLVLIFVKFNICDFTYYKNI